MYMVYSVLVLTLRNTSYYNLQVYYFLLRLIRLFFELTRTIQSNVDIKGTDLKYVLV